MVDIDVFIKCQKLTWMRRLIQSPDAPWVKLFSSLICAEKFYLLGPLWTQMTANNISNNFWKEVFIAWGSLLDKREPAKFELLSCPIWYNSRISTKPLFYPHWYKAGILTLLDLLNNDGNLKTLEEIRLQYGVKSNFLEYMRIQRSLKGFLNNYDLSELDVARPFFPPYIKLLLYQNKGCQQFYKINGVTF